MKHWIAGAAIGVAVFGTLALVAFGATYAMALTMKVPCDNYPVGHSVTPGWSYATHCEGKGLREVFKGTYAGWVLWRVTPL